MKLRTSLRGLVSQITNFFGRGFSGFSWFASGLGGALDYSKEAGARYDNSAVSAAIQWMQRRVSEVSLTVHQVKRTGVSKEIDHEFVSVFNDGPVYDGTVLLWGSILSLVVTGNAYWYKVRSKSGAVVGFALMDYSRTRPMADKYRTEANMWSPTTYYEFRNPDGAVLDLPIEDVVHFRFGIDPANHKLGMSPIAAALREIVTDNEAALLGVALLKNGGIPGIAFEPKENVEGFTPESQVLLERRVRDRTTGAGAGRTMMMPFAGEWKIIGHSPDKLVLNETRAMAVSRILSGLGIDPMVLGFPSENKTYSNYAEANEAAVENCFLPLLSLIERTLTAQCLVPDFLAGPRTKLVVKFDTSQVRALQPDLDKLWGRTGSAFTSDLITRGEAREMLGYAPGDDADMFYSEIKSGGMDTQGDKPDDPVKNFKKSLMARVATLN